MESHARAIAKTLSYRTLGIAVTGAVALVVTGRLEAAATIGAADALVKLGVYYAHERAWNRIALGRAKPPEYQI
jgi:uncharacterized membrane protein